MEFTVRYPVELRRTAEIDDRVTSALVAVLDRYPAAAFVRPAMIQAAGT